MKLKIKNIYLSCSVALCSGVVYAQSNPQSNPPLDLPVPPDADTIHLNDHAHEPSKFDPMHPDNKVVPTTSPIVKKIGDVNYIYRVDGTVSVDYSGKVTQKELKAKSVLKKPTVYKKPISEEEYRKGLNAWLAKGTEAYEEVAPDPKQFKDNLGDDFVPEFEEISILSGCKILKLGEEYSIFPEGAIIHLPKSFSSDIVESLEEVSSLTYVDPMLFIKKHGKFMAVQEVKREKVESEDDNADPVYEFVINKSIVDSAKNMNKVLFATVSGGLCGHKVNIK